MLQDSGFKKMLVFDRLGFPSVLAFCSSVHIYYPFHLISMHM